MTKRKNDRATIARVIAKGTGTLTKAELLALYMSPDLREQMVGSNNSVLIGLVDQAVALCADGSGGACVCACVWLRASVSVCA